MNRRLSRAGNRFAVWLYRRFDGRFSGGQVLMITSPGRRSGLPRSTCVRYLDADEGYLVWGSGSGARSDPDWFRNLRASARSHVRIGAASFPVQAQELTGAARDRVWQDVVLAQVPSVARYARRAGRPIPVAVLVRRPAAGQAPGRPSGADAGEAPTAG
jgi:deazaflavin-dependent oxidoreductase (nitroreductase family)